jgi:peptidoglycan/LPS O-acetylase OafA/YrhL
MIGDASEVCDAYTYDMEHGGHGIVSEEIHEQRTETMEMQAMDPFSAPPLQKKQYQFIHWIRAVAVCLIIWCHLGWMWLGQAQISCKLNDMINGWIFNPLAIREGAGSLGVFLFFACSGFVITHSLSEENRRSFAVKRLFRIYPAIISSFVLVFLGTMLCLFITKSPVWWEQYPITVWLENAFMINSFFNSNPVIIPPMWFLFIEMIFYAVCFLLLPLLKRKPNIALTAELLLCLAAIFTVGLGGDVYIRIASAISYLPYLIFGQLVYYWWNGRITTRISGIFFAIIYYLIVKNIYVFYPEYYGAANSYGVSFIYTVCIFMICLMLNYRIKSNTIIRKISNWSYSIYLLHMPIGQMVLLLLHQKIGYPLAFTTALIVIFALSYLQYTFVEKAFIKLGKKLY